MQAQLREQRSTFAWSQGLLILQIGAAVVLLAAAAVLARALTEPEDDRGRLHREQRRAGDAGHAARRY